MNTNVTMGQMNPTAAIAINKGLLRTYNKKSDTPTYYLKKGQEFQIELFNATQDYILAKITLNNKLISQGGLVLRPGERVFLDRFLDVEKKFLFDTYEVSGGNEVQQAIRNNGDVKVEFYKEKEKPFYVTNTNTGRWYGNDIIYGDGTYTTSSFTSNSIGATTTNDLSFSTTSTTSGEVTLDWMDNTLLRSSSPKPEKSRVRKSLKSKSIETGRVEKGSKSNQKFKTVDKEFDYFPFHTVSYKLLPQSQQNIETKELRNIHCTSCGVKGKSTHKFCSGCGQKL